MSCGSVLLQNGYGSLLPVIDESGFTESSFDFLTGILQRNALLFRGNDITAWCEDFFNEILSKRQVAYENLAIRIGRQIVRNDVALLIQQRTIRAINTAVGNRAIYRTGEFSRLIEKFNAIGSDGGSGQRFALFGNLQSAALLLVFNHDRYGVLAGQVNGVNRPVQTITLRSRQFFQINCIMRALKGAGCSANLVCGHGRELMGTGRIRKDAKLSAG